MTRQPVGEACGRIRRGENLGDIRAAPVVDACTRVASAGRSISRVEAVEAVEASDAVEAVEAIDPVEALVGARRTVAVVEATGAPAAGPGIVILSAVLVLWSLVIAVVAIARVQGGHLRVFPRSGR